MIAIGSRSLNENEKNYCTTLLEMLAFVTYVDQFAQFDLLQLKKVVLYLQSPDNTSSTKQWMVLPPSLVKQALIEVHDGPAGAHLGRMKTLKKINAKFWKPGLTKDVHQYIPGCTAKSEGCPATPERCLRQGSEANCLSTSRFRLALYSTAEAR